MDWKSRRIRKVLEAALAEDKAASDVTTALTVDAKMRATGTIVAKQPCVVAGLGSIAVFLEIFAEMNGGSTGRFEVVSHPEIFDGVRVKKGQTLAVIRHNAAAILSCERAILNLLQRMSGIATLTNEYVRVLAGTKTKVLDTRKTIPGLRTLDRYAVCCGGGLNHRQDLQDGILIKGSHIALAGGLGPALERALKGRKQGQIVQVEVGSQEELEEAIAGGAESLLLDHMTPAAVKRAVKRIHEAMPGVPIEAAGGVTLETARAYAETGVDYVTVGALTNSAPAADLSMRITSDVS
jgi:nicotinate-nucleotide pyrophosphorylase (carboxylating)